MFKLSLQSPVFMRTYFSYDPKVDVNAPCAEAGLKFDRGNILQVVNRDDPDWWQAMREGDQRHRVGIVPSRTLRERSLLTSIYAYGSACHCGGEEMAAFSQAALLIGPKGRL